MIFSYLSLFRLDNPLYTKDHHFVNQISYIHAALGEAVMYVSGYVIKSDEELYLTLFRNISRAFGAALLALIASCLLHLVATSYFLFVELLGSNVSFINDVTL